jgi:SAM-dependent methyltransferase
MEKYCEVCGGKLHAFNSWVAKCKNCGFQCSSLKPAAGTGIPGLERLRRENMEKILNHIEKVSPLTQAKILEVGSAWGWFLEAATRRGAIVHGIEAEKSNVIKTQDNGFSVEHGFFPQDLKNRGPYDIIIFNDVFEHIPNPSRVIVEVQNLLTPSGLAIFNYPSSNGFFFHVASILASIGFDSSYARLWQKGFPSPHISYFNSKNIKVLVQNNTCLEPVIDFQLKTVSRVGLKQRIAPSFCGIKKKIIYSMIFSFSFFLPLFPSDIEVSVFRKPENT